MLATSPLVAAILVFLAVAVIGTLIGLLLSAIMPAPFAAFKRALSIVAGVVVALILGLLIWSIIVSTVTFSPVRVAAPIYPSGAPLVAQPAPAGSTANTTITNFGDLELFTLPNPEGTFQIGPDQIGATWWHVTLDGAYLGDCVGAWLLPGNYSISSPGRLRVWTRPNQADLTTFQQWWMEKVQAEAQSVCTYSWITK